MHRQPSVVHKRSPVIVIGAGIVGSWQALLFAQAGYEVTLIDRDDPALTHATSYWAGGMLAPWCEGKTSEPLITRLGVRSLDLWRRHLPETPFNGSLVVAHRRDRSDFENFAKLTSEHVRIAADGLVQLEPSLAGRFPEALFFPGEGHVEPRTVIPQLHAQFVLAGGLIRFGSEYDPRNFSEDLDGIVIDCRGLAAREQFPDLRGVKGEMVVVETPDVQLARPVRLIHPRWPLYIIPRDDNCFMIGATTIESDDTGVSVRSALELLTAAYAVQPAFAEARIVEFGAGIRPAFPDNLPRIVVSGRKLSINGLYRHGFLLAPVLAEMTLAYAQNGFIHNEIMRSS